MRIIGDRAGYSVDHHHQPVHRIINGLHRCVARFSRNLRFEAWQSVDGPTIRRKPPHEAAGGRAESAAWAVHALIPPATCEQPVPDILRRALSHYALQLAKLGGYLARKGAAMLGAPRR